jgi:hypothetical protein
MKFVHGDSTGCPFQIGPFLGAGRSSQPLDLSIEEYGLFVLILRKLRLRRKAK